MPIVFAALLIVLVQPQLYSLPVGAIPAIHVNPVPYYAQGNKPWCAVATAKMAIAYATYPNEPPTLDDLAKEMGTGDVGTTPYQWWYAMQKRNIPTELCSYDFENLRLMIRSGYLIDVTLITRIGSGSADSHAILIIGYNGSGLIIHDPARGPALTYSDHDIRSAWARAQVVKRAPGEIPNYVVKVRLFGLGKSIPIVVDGVSESIREFKFRTGETHTIEIQKIVVRDQNETCQITWETSAVDKLQIWSVGLQELNGRYDEVIRYRVKVRTSQFREEGIEKGGVVTVEIPASDKIRPADSVLGMLGFKKSFTGWSVNGIVASHDNERTIRIDKPVEITEAWEIDLSQGGGYGLLGLYSFALLVGGLVVLVGGTRYHAKKKTCPQN